MICVSELGSFCSRQNLEGGPNQTSPRCVDLLTFPQHAGPENYKTNSAKPFRICEMTFENYVSLYSLLSRKSAI
jgi:hypothetical protein